MKYHFSPPPPNKKEYVHNLAKGLVKNYGKKKFYSPDHVISVNDEIYQNNAVNFYWWGMCLFCSYDDFVDTYEPENNDKENSINNLYDDMRLEMLLEFTTAYIENWQDIPMIDHDISWIDFGELSEDIFEGIGEFISGIFEVISS